MANFPASISTNNNLYVAVNGIQTTLASSITNSQTTITLTSTSGFPTTGLVTIENNEVISYTGISGADLTGCTRGADGTTALAHSTGVTVGLTVVAAHHNLLKDEIIAIETFLGVNGANVQPAGNYITALTGDVTATGPGSVAATLATVNSNVGVFTLATVTVNAKGLITAASAASTTGSGSVVLATSPTLVTPALGTPSSAVLTNATGLPIDAGTTGTLPVTRGGTGTTTSTGTGSVVLSNSPTLVTPALGTPSAAVLTNATGLPLTTGVTGVLPDANTTATPAATASTIVERDSNINTRVNEVIENFSTTVTAAGTTTLTVSSSPLQQFTGTTTQTMKLPDATTLVVGQYFTVLNRSTGSVTVNNNGNSLVATVTANTQVTFIATSIATSNGTWDVSTVGSGITQLTGDVTAGPGTGSQAATVATVGGQTAGVIASSAQNVANIIINGGMEIWQRNTTFTSPADAVYTADRWAVKHDGTPTFTISRESSITDSGNYAMKLDITAISGSPTFLQLRQLVENYKDYANKTLALYARVRSNVSGTQVRFDDGSTSFVSNAHSGGGAYETLSVTGTMGSSPTKLQISLGVSSSNPVVSTIYFDSVMLVVGSTVIPFVPTDPTTLIAKCMRYYEKSYAIDTAPGTNTTTNHVRVAATNWTVSEVDTTDIVFKVQKRAAPTVTPYRDDGTSGSWGWWTSSTTTTNLTTSVNYAGTNSFGLYQTADLTYRTAAQGHWVADAEMGI